MAKKRFDNCLVEMDYLCTFRWGQCGVPRPGRGRAAGGSDRPERQLSGRSGLEQTRPLPGHYSTVPPMTVNVSYSLGPMRDHIFVSGLAVPPIRVQEQTF